MFLNSKCGCVHHGIRAMRRNAKTKMLRGEVLRLGCSMAMPGQAVVFDGEM